MCIRDSSKTPLTRTDIRHTTICTKSNYMIIFYNTTTNFYFLTPTVKLRIVICYNHIKIIIMYTITGQELAPLS